MYMPSNQKIDKEIFRTIFINHWESFKNRHPGYDISQYEDPVQKMLGCGKESAGYSEYSCVYCGGDVRRIEFSLKIYTQLRTEQNRERSKKSAGFLTLSATAAIWHDFCFYE